MDQIKISAKNLGQIALDDFCPRCFWIKLKVNNKLPWQIFPGIFSSIDSYTKKCTHILIDKGLQDLPWLSTLGEITKYHKTPHWSKFTTDFPELAITLNGSMDDIFELQSEAFVIADYKTSRYTPNQDKLLPLYRIQLNGYKIIAERCGFKDVSGLWLIYFEPATEEGDAEQRAYPNGFDMRFNAKPIQIEIDDSLIIAALEKTREIYELPLAPRGVEGCKDCQNLNPIIDMFS